MAVEVEKGHEKTYQWVIGLLKDADFEGAAKRLGLKLISKDELAVDFLGRVYSITRDAITVSSETINWDTGSCAFEWNTKSVLGYYALSDADLEPANDFCLLKSFSHGVFESSSGALSHKSPLNKVYGSDYNKFREAALELGMKDEGLQGAGKKWHYDLLPKMPVKLIYYEGDDEFPTDIKIFFDKTAIEIYKFEPLAVLHGCFIQGLAAIG
jgi:hypothetical protein